MAMATPISDNTIRVKIMSFNMHGFHQGCPVLDDMIELFNPDVLLLQEHWLTPANLNKFDSHFTNYFSLLPIIIARECELQWLDVVIKLNKIHCHQPCFVKSF